VKRGEDRLRSGANWLTGEDWAAQWRSFTRSAFRLETLPVYKVGPEEEEFQQFLAGEPPPPDSDDTDWIRRVRAYVADGKHVGRVHLVTPPLTDYLRYQFEWGYEFQVAAGEDVRILDLTRTENPGVPEQDFWLFDDETVVLMHYDVDGTQLGRERLVDVDVSPYRRYMELAREHGVPYLTYKEATAS
jgi:hypothetical protein